MTTDDVRQLLRDKIAEAGTAKDWAHTAGVSSPYVSDVINGNREPGESILTALGLERVVTYRSIK